MSTSFLFFRLMMRWVILCIVVVGLASCGTKKKTASRQTPDFEWSEGSTSSRNRSKPKDDGRIKKEVEKEESSLRYSRSDIEDFLDDWWGVPHRMGGNTKKGIDCSGLMCVIYDDLYNDPLQYRRAQDIYSELDPILDPEDLRVGDMVFFKVGGVRIDHVGIYLGKGDFAHASSSRGVMKSNLSQNYWKQRFFRGGRKR